MSNKIRETLDNVGGKKQEIIEEIEEFEAEPQAGNGGGKKVPTTSPKSGSVSKASLSSAHGSSSSAHSISGATSSRSNLTGTNIGGALVDSNKFGENNSQEGTGGENPPSLRGNSSNNNGNNDNSARREEMKRQQEAVGRGAERTKWCRSC